MLLVQSMSKCYNTIHHLINIVGIGAGLVYEKSGSELVAALWITEIFSPFLHRREMLKELGYKDTGLNLTADVTFAAIFTFARMVCGPYLTYLTLSARNPIIIKIFLLVWFGMLLGMWLELECYWKMVGCWVWVGVLLSVYIGVLDCGCLSIPTGRRHYYWKSSLKSCYWNISINL